MKALGGTLLALVCLLSGTLCYFLYQQEQEINRLWQGYCEAEDTIGWYQDTLDWYQVRLGERSTLSFDEPLASADVSLILSDARDTHQFYANNPEACNDSTGDAEFNEMWVVRYTRLLDYFRGE